MTSFKDRITAAPILDQTEKDRLLPELYDFLYSGESYEKAGPRPTPLPALFIKLMARQIITSDPSGFPAHFNLVHKDDIFAFDKNRIITRFSFDYGNIEKEKLFTELGEDVDELNDLIKTYGSESEFTFYNISCIPFYYDIYCFRDSPNVYDRSNFFTYTSSPCSVEVSIPKYGFVYHRYKKRIEAFVRFYLDKLANCKYTIRMEILSDTHKGCTQYVNFFRHVLEDRRPKPAIDRSVLAQTKNKISQLQAISRADRQTSVQNRKRATEDRQLFEKRIKVLQSDLKDMRVKEETWKKEFAKEISKGTAIPLEKVKQMETRMKESADKRRKTLESLGSKIDRVHGMISGVEQTMGTKQKYFAEKLSSLEKRMDTKKTTQSDQMERSRRQLQKLTDKYKSLKSKYKQLKHKKKKEERKGGDDDSSAPRPPSPSPTKKPPVFKVDQKGQFVM